jgi:hexosaminidase
VDLGRPMNILRVGLDCLRSQGAWIFYPLWIDVQGSEDGESWLEMGRVEVPRERIEERQSRRFEVSAPEGFPGVRFLRVRAGNHGALPTWHPGAGEDAWLFVDEILVE